MTRLGRGAWIVIALLAMEAVYVTSRLELVTGLAPLLPDARDQELAWVSARLVDSPLTRTMVLSVSAPELPAAIAGMREFAAAVAPHPEGAALRGGPEEGFPEAVHALYFPRRSYFLSNQPEAELPLRFSDEGLDRAAARLRGELASPRADLVKSLAAEDPVLAFLDLARGFERTRVIRQRCIQKARDLYQPPLDHGIGLDQSQRVRLTHPELGFDRHAHQPGSLLRIRGAAGSTRELLLER